MAANHPKRYLGNKNPSSKEVHDLHNEKTNCQIDEIISAEYFDYREDARNAGYDNCAYCIGNSKR